jgi:selenocysteine lyase/cysteine desulfurase
MNDLFGISTRGGISCCGILSEHYKNKYNVDGWCRISYSYMFDKKTIDYITKAVEYIILNHNKYINDYIYNSKTNLYMRK